jgi:hypothetical protein
VGHSPQVAVRDGPLGAVARLPDRMRRHGVQPRRAVRVEATAVTVVVLSVVLSVVPDVAPAVVTDASEQWRLVSL